MKLAAIMVLGLTLLVLFAALVFTMSNLTNSTVWTDMNNTAFETGITQVAFTFGFLGCGLALMYLIFKGKPPSDRFGGG